MRKSLLIKLATFTAAILLGAGWNIATHRDNFLTASRTVPSIFHSSEFSRADAIPAESQNYMVLAVNDLGMHCIQPDYSTFFILPPANNLKVQVFNRKNEGKLVREGITVEYNVKNNTNPAGKINFWKYASSYGYDVPPNVGITENTLSGTMKLDESKRYWEASAIPVVPYNDEASLENAYQVATITVKEDTTDKIIATLDNVVLPVSDEMDCGGCHGHAETDKKILTAHDQNEKTNLIDDLNAGIRHRCNECHADPILEAPGKPGVPSLSLAIHGFHADKMKMSKLEPVCFNCHPGVVTQCNRGVMSKKGFRCNSKGCHGSMAQVAETIRRGRTPWLNEPGCANKGCHSNKYATNKGKLYRESYLKNGPDKEMNNKILCENCHNGTHAEWPSTKTIDNLVPKQVQGNKSFINRCVVCHAKQPQGKVHRG